MGAEPPPLPLPTPLPRKKVEGRAGNETRAQAEAGAHALLTPHSGEKSHNHTVTYAARYVTSSVARIPWCASRNAIINGEVEDGIESCGGRFARLTLCATARRRTGNARPARPPASPPPNGPREITWLREGWTFGLAVGVGNGLCRGGRDEVG